jgi:hypothetical protein
MSMSGYDDPHGVGRWDKGVTDSVEDVLIHGREPSERELEVMNAEPLLTRHEEDRQHFGELGDKVVQVRIAGATARRTYAYEVPFGVDVSFGDWVTLPGNVVNEHGGFGIVKGFGRDGYRGPLKSIVAKIDEPSDLMIRMSVVKTKQQASKIYEEAVAAGETREGLLELIKVGQDRLKARGVR